MVHVSFVRKQLSIYIKIILIASLFVYVLSVLASLIPSRPRGRRSPGSLRGNKQQSVSQSKSDTVTSQKSLIDRWTDYAQRMFGKSDGDSVTRGSVNVHRWYTVCGNTVDNLRRHILFPKHPKLRTTVTVLRMRTKLRDFGQRIFGYIHPPLSGSYQFSVSSDDFSEVWLSTDASPNNTNIICQVGGMYKGNFIMGSTRPGEFGRYESQTSSNIYLDSDKKYFFEVLHKQGGGLGHVHVAWKMPGWKYFTIITSEFISLFMKEDYSKSMLKREDHAVLPEAILTHHQHLHVEYRASGNYRNYTRFTNITGYQLLPQSSKSLPICGKSDRLFVKKLKRYQGRFYTQIPSVFPMDGSSLVVQTCQNAKSAGECKGNPLLDEQNAREVAENYLKASRFGNYSLESIVRVEQILEKHTGDYRYFLDLIVEDKMNGAKWRLAEHVIQSYQHRKFCTPVNYLWNPDVTIYVIITVKNQGIWLRHFIDNMVEIQQQTKDKHLHPIIVDFGSKDIDLDDYLKNSNVRHFTVIHKTGHFYKTSAINEAAASVKNNNSIILQLDLHLDVPLNLMQIVRKHTIQGHMAFVPLLTRLACGSSPDYPTGHWEEQGYGLFAIYKSDWIRFGGMNTREFSNHWGGEDWEMIDRVISENIAVEKLKIPGLFHFYHNRRGMWEKAH